MSRYANKKQSPITTNEVRSRKEQGKKLSMVTCYDAAFARLVETSGIDMVLVGDSLGNVMLGHGDTIPVTMADMIHHTASVARVLHTPLLAADMPFFSYKVSVEQALSNAARLIQEGGAQAVKVEGGIEICPQVKAIVDAGIPVIGHLGLTPQSVHALGGFKVQGRGDGPEAALIAAAKALEAAGAFCIVLELIPAKLAEKVTKAVKVPTIGIGAGPNCDGQVLVIHDMLGFDQGFNPKFLKKYANLGAVIESALKQYDDEVKTGKFPETTHSFFD
jgi:3-methyl-2-oxobutanoate hydroxymethyltransferase